MANEQLTVEVVVDSKGAEVGFKDLEGRLRTLDGNLLKMNGSLKVVEKSLDDVESAVAKAFANTKPVQSLTEQLKSLGKSVEKAAIPLLAVNQGLELVNRAMQAVDQTIGKAVRSFVQLESAVARINTLIPEAERAAYDFSEAIRQQQRLFGTDVATAGKAFYEAIASGAVDAQGAIELMDTAQKLAIGGATSLDTAVSALTTVMSSYGIAAEDAGKISNTLFIAAAGGKTDIDQLSKQLGDVVGIARAAGVSFEEVASAISAVTAAGQPTAIAVTGVRAAISELLTPTKELQVALKNLGITNVEAAIKQEGFVKVIRKLSDAYGGNATALAALFARVESLPALTALVSGKVGAQFDGMLKSATGSVVGLEDVTNRAFTTMAETIEQRMARARGSLEVELANIGKVLSKSFGPATADATESVQKLVETLRQLLELLAPIAALVVESIGGALLPILNSAIDGFRNLGEWIGFAAEKMEDFLIAQGAMAARAVIPEPPKEAPAAGGGSKPGGAGVNQEAIREAVKALEKLREENERVAKAIQLVGKTQAEQAQIEKAFRLDQLKATEDQLKAVELLGGMNQKTLADAKAGIIAYYAALEKQGALEDLKKKTEEQKRALEEQRRVIESVGKAYLQFAATVEKMADALSMAKFDSAQLASTPLNQQLDLAERTYQVTLRQIDAERQKAIEANVSVKAADEQASKAVATAQAMLEQTRILEVQRSVRQALQAAEAAADAGLRSMNAQRMADNESLLRIGMSRQETAARELEIEIDKIDALEEQLRRAEKLDRFALAELDLARKTAQEKAKVAAAPTPGSAESAVGIGAAAGAATSMAGSASPVGAFMAAAEMIVGIVQKLIDFIPNIINAVAKIFSSLADLPNMILKAVSGLISSLVKFTAEFIPNLFSAIPEIIDQILTAAFETLPAAAQKLFEQLPSLIEGLLKKIPDLVAKLVDGLVSNSAKISIGLIGALISNLPAFFKAFALFMPRLFLALAKGIVNGIINGVKGIGKAVSGLFKGAGKTITDGAKTFGKSIADGLKRLTGFKGDMFGVQDDVKGAAKTGSDLMKQIQDAGKSAYNWLMKAWELIKAGWKWVYDTLLKPWIDLLSMTWDFIWSTGKTLFEFAKNVFMVIWNLGREMFDASIGLLKAAWSVINEAILKPFISILKQTWEFIKTGIIDPIISAFMAVWEFAKSMFGAVIDTFKALWNFVKTLFDDPVKAFKQLWEDFKAIFGNVIAAFQTLGAKIWDSLRAAFDAAVEYIKGIGTTIWNGLKAAWDKGIDALADFGGKIWSSVKTAFASIGDLFSGAGSAIWESMKKAFSGFGDWFTGLLDKLNPMNLLAKIFKLDKMDKNNGAVEKFLGLEMPWVEFASGGMVPGKANVFGDSSMNDTIPALLSPGEAVIPRSLMKDPAVAKLVSTLLGGDRPKGFFLGSVGSAIGDGLSSAGNTIGEGAASVGGAIQSGAKAVVDFVTPDWVQKLFDSISKLVKNIDLGAMVKDPAGYLKKTIKSAADILMGEPFKAMTSGIGLKMAMGGFVPGAGYGDTTPAMLTPGEFVMKRSAADSIGANALQAMNQTGRIPQVQGGDVNVSLTVNTQQAIDENYVRRTLMPTVKDEFKKASLRGEFLISQRGVRT